MTAGGPTISVVMPAFGAERLMPRVLAPLMAMQARGEVAEVIVVDDRSPDRTAEVAREMGAGLIAMPTAGRQGMFDALRGSTTERVLREAGLPILATPV